MTATRISKLQKKMLIYMLRYEKEEIPNASRKRFGGQKPMELAILVRRYKYVRPWHYERSLKSLVENELVIYGKMKYGDGKMDWTWAYKLSDKGKELADKLEREMKDQVEEWAKVLGYKMEKAT